LLDFLEAFLNAVFPEITLPGGVGVEDGFEGKRLGNGDETNAGGVATG